MSRSKGRLQAYREAADGTVASVRTADDSYSSGNLRATTAGGQVLRIRRRQRHPGIGAVCIARRDGADDAASGIAARRSLYERRPGAGTRHHRRSAVAASVSADTATSCHSWRGRKRCCATAAGASINTITGNERDAMSRTITISTAVSIRCSSIPTGNIAAPISNRRISRSTTPSSPRSGILPRSCW